MHNTQYIRMHYSPDSNYNVYVNFEFGPYFKKEILELQFPNITTTRPLTFVFLISTKPEVYSVVKGTKGKPYNAAPMLRRSEKGIQFVHSWFNKNILSLWDFFDNFPFYDEFRRRRMERISRLKPIMCMKQIIFLKINK